MTDKCYKCGREIDVSQYRGMNAVRYMCVGCWMEEHP